MVIRRAFERLSETKDKIAHDGLVEFMDDAMDVLMDEHDKYAQQSKTFDNYHGFRDNDTVACGIANRGDVLWIWGQQKGEPVPYNVATQMNDTLLSHRENGWCASLLSGMVNGERPHRKYNEQHERDFLESTILWAKAFLPTYFKPIK